ncbi:MAG: hypothetical protein ACRD7E_03440 [Bryobacteraceae bacterium]
MLNQPGSPEQYATRFNHLLQDLLGGTLKRNCFQAWEIELLLDIQSCALTRSSRRQVLRRYQKAVNRQFDKGAGRPFTLSDYLRRCADAAAQKRAA